MLKILKRMRRHAGTVESRALTLAAAVTTSKHADGVILLHSGTGSVYTANGTAARMFEALRNGGTPETIGVALGAELGAPAEVVAADTARFAAELEAQGILVRTRAA